MTQPSPRRIFVSYSHRDGRWLEEDSEHGIVPWLQRSLRRDGISLWYDRSGLVPGDEYRRCIEREIDQADLALLLVSEEFLSSDFIATVELPRIEARAQAGKLIAVPVLLETCRWQQNAFIEARHVLPGNAVPLIRHLSDDAVWADVRSQILAGVMRALEGMPAVQPQAPACDLPAEAASASHRAAQTAHGPTRGNLPARLTPFVGRRREVEQITALLDDPMTRLVTLTGPPGVGKTRLALKVATECAARFTDGAWWVSLEQVQSAEAVPSALASALGVEVKAQESPLVRLRFALSGRNLLVVCDNFEQVIDAASFLDDLLASAPELKCLVTSRRPLEITGERVYGLLPMPAPPSDASATDLCSYDSVALFAERAQRVSPGWTITPSNATAVGDVCRQLEGIPLGIELAASRLSGMTTEEVSEGLRDRLRSLAGGRGSTGRHRTLQAAVDWSYALLSAEEQDLLAQLSVFRGGFFREAAEAVTDQPSALELILRLRAHSLLQAQQVGHRTRYAMFDMIREYASEKLTSSGSESFRSVSARHAAFFCAFAERRSDLARTAREREAAEELWRELDNLRAALAWAFDHDDELCARLAPSTNGLFTSRGLWDEALLWAERGLAAAGRAGDSRLAVRLQLCLASAHHDRRDLSAARSLADQSLALSECLGDLPRKARALNLLGIIAQDGGDSAEAVRLHETALSLRREDGDRVGEAMSLHNLALVEQSQNRPDEAGELYQQALAIRRGVGDLRGVAETACNIGVIAQKRGETDQAAASYREALQSWRDLNDAHGIALAMHNLGEIALGKGQLDTALAALVASEETFSRIGSPLASESAALLASLRERLGCEAFEERVATAKGSSLENVADLVLGSC